LPEPGGADELGLAEVSVLAELRPVEPDVSIEPNTFELHHSEPRRPVFGSERCEELVQQARRQMGTAEIDVITRLEPGKERLPGLRIHMRQAPLGTIDADADVAVQSTGWPFRRL
jgi:hypothetical protein